MYKYEIKSPSSLQYSPDEKTLAFTLVQPDKENNKYNKNHGMGAKNVIDHFKICKQKGMFLVMKKTIKLTSVLLVLSMFLSNIAYADELIESEGIANKISSAMTYGVDKVKNTVLNAIPYEVQTDNESNNKKLQFHDPGMDLTSKDIKTLYDMGYSMVDISNAITLSAVSDETPYEILQ